MWTVSQCFSVPYVCLRTPQQSSSLPHIKPIVTDDPGSKPDQRFTRRRDKFTFGKLSKNLGLRVKRIPSWYNILVQWKGADFEVVVVRFMTVFVERRDSACS